MKHQLIILFVILSGEIFAQGTTADNKNHYAVSTGEFIFSGGQVVNKFDGTTLHNVIRFSAFFHFQNQYHFDFGPHAGMYTGFGVRNVGFINDIKVKDHEDARIKQRSYSFGVPLALKLGNMEKHAYLAVGAEAELMFAYKQKILFEGSKQKSYDWFSDRVNIFNPSVFAEIHFRKGGFIRARYYVLDFLKNQDMSFDLPGINGKILYQPQSSKMFYISIGKTIKMKSKKKNHVTKSNA